MKMFIIHPSQTNTNLADWCGAYPWQLNYFSLFCYQMKVYRWEQCNVLKVQEWRQCNFKKSVRI